MPGGAGGQAVHTAEDGGDAGGDGGHAQESRCEEQQHGHVREGAQEAAGSAQGDTRARPLAGRG